MFVSEILRCIFQFVDLLLVRVGGGLVAEPVSAFEGEDCCRGIVRSQRFFERGKTLVDERLEAVLVLLGDDGIGGGEDVEVTVCAGDFGGGGLGFFGTNQLHFVIGEAV